MPTDAAIARYELEDSGWDMYRITRAITAYMAGDTGDWDDYVAALNAKSTEAGVTVNEILVGTPPNSPRDTTVKGQLTGYMSQGQYFSSAGQYSADYIDFNESWLDQRAYGVHGCITNGNQLQINQVGAYLIIARYTNFDGDKECFLNVAGTNIDRAYSRLYDTTTLTGMVRYSALSSPARVYVRRVNATGNLSHPSITIIRMTHM